MPAVTRGRAHVDARAVLIRPDADDHVVAKAHDRRARDRFDPSFAAAGLRGARLDHAPLAFRHHGERRVVGFLRADRDDQGLDVRIGAALLGRNLGARIGQRIGAARPQARNRLEARRIGHVGRDVVDRRQPIEPVGEESLIGEHREPDRERGDREAKPAEPCRQMTTKPPNASRIAAKAKNSAPASVAIAGTASRKPRLTITIASSTTAMANKASRRDHMASLEIGSSAKRRRVTYSITAVRRFA